MTPDMLEQIVRAEVLSWVAIALAAVAMYKSQKK